MELSNRVIVVTGAARGIGRALARRFASESPKAVIVADIDGGGAKTVAEEIMGTAIECNISHEADVERMVKQVEAAHGQIDLFCSNAGIAVGGGPEADDSDWQRIWEVNVMAHVFVARQGLRGMLHGNEGYIVGTVSAGGVVYHGLGAPR